METWMLVPIAVLVIGVAVVVYGALRDRSRRLRVAQMLRLPPDRDIPGLDPSVTPGYLPGPEAHGRTGPLPVLAGQPAARTEGHQVGYGAASPEFATHASGVAVLDDPVVLVCADPVTSTVEVLHALARHATDGRTAVLVAPRVADEVRTTLQVNVVRGKLALLVVEIPDDEVRAEVTTLVGAEPVTGFDLHAGYVPVEHLGHAEQWLSDADRTWILSPPATTTATTTATTPTETPSTPSAPSTPTTDTPPPDPGTQ